MPRHVICGPCGQEIYVKPVPEHFEGPAGVIYAAPIPESDWVSVQLEFNQLPLIAMHLECYYAVSTPRVDRLFNPETMKFESHIKDEPAPDNQNGN